MALFRPPFRPNYAQKLSILATLPLVVAVAAIALLVAFESSSSAEREIQALQQQLLAAKKAELRNYVTQARNGFSFIYGRASPDDNEAKEQVAQILSSMIYGTDGSFLSMTMTAPILSVRGRQNSSRETGRASKTARAPP